MVIVVFCTENEECWREIEKKIRRTFFLLFSGPVCVRLRLGRIG